MNDDLTLLREYAQGNSEEAFAALVSRHVNLVYSVALRQVREPQLAEEITQAVFIILARKAASLGPKTILSGWLCRTARYASANALTIQRRRQHREQEAHMQSTLDVPATEETWSQIAPLLEVAMEKLGQKDHDAVVLRFFEGRNFKEVGAALGTSEDAAKMRVNRALEKLRKFFTKRGMSSTTAIIAGAISANSVQVAPVALAKSVTAVTIAKGAAASGSILTLIKGALKIMAWTKAKTAIVVGVGVLLATGITTITVKEIEKYKTYPWQVKSYDSRVLDQAPPQVRILPAKYPQTSGGWGTSRGKIMGLGAPVKNVIQAAYASTYGTKHLTRIIPLIALPSGRFDFISSLAGGNAEALQTEVKQKFGVVAKLETRETDVLLLAVKSPHAPGLKPSANRGNGRIIRQGVISSSGSEIGSLRQELEDYFQIPVLDRTGLNGIFNMDATWDEPVKGQNRDALRQALIDQLGLELVPSREPVEMLVVEKVKQPK